MNRWELSQEAVAGWTAFVKRQRKWTEASGIRTLLSQGMPQSLPTPPRLPQLWPPLSILINSPGAVDHGLLVGSFVSSAVTKAALMSYWKNRALLQARDSANTERVVPGGRGGFSWECEREFSSFPCSHRSCLLEHHRSHRLAEGIPHSLKGLGSNSLRRLGQLPQDLCTCLCPVLTPATPSLDWMPLPLSLVTLTNGDILLLSTPTRLPLLYLNFGFTVYGNF